MTKQNRTQRSLVFPAILAVMGMSVLSGCTDSSTETMQPTATPQPTATAESETLTIPVVIGNRFHSDPIGPVPSPSVTGSLPQIEWRIGDEVVGSFPYESFVRPQPVVTIPSEGVWEFFALANGNEVSLGVVDPPAWGGVEALSIGFSDQLERCVTQASSGKAEASCDVVTVEPMSFDQWEFLLIMGPE